MGNRAGINALMLKSDPSMKAEPGCDASIRRCTNGRYSTTEAIPSNARCWQITMKSAQCQPHIQGRVIHLRIRLPRLTTVITSRAGFPLKPAGPGLGRSYCQGKVLMQRVSVGQR
jgi:hypothetical protein